MNDLEQVNALREWLGLPLIVEPRCFVCGSKRSLRQLPRLMASRLPEGTSRDDFPVCSECVCTWYAVPGVTSWETLRAARERLGDGGWTGAKSRAAHAWGGERGEP